MNKIVYCVGLLSVLSQSHTHAVKVPSKYRPQEQCWQKADCAQHPLVKIGDAILERIIKKPQANGYTQLQYVSVEHSLPCTPTYLDRVQEDLSDRIAVRFWMGPVNPAFYYSERNFNLSKPHEESSGCGGYANFFKKWFTEKQNLVLQRAKNAALQRVMGESFIPKNTLTAEITVGADERSGHLTVVTPHHDSKEEFSIKIHPLTVEEGQSPETLKHLAGTVAAQAAYVRRSHDLFKDFHEQCRKEKQQEEVKARQKAYERKVKALSRSV